MTPPKGPPLDIHAPLSQWHIAKALDSAAACEQVRADLNEAGERKLTDDESYRRFQNSQCVSTDDPRLKAK